MDVARLNGSHGDQAWHGATIEMLRAVDPSIPILLDIPGRKIRTGQLAVEPRFEAGAEIVLTGSTDAGAADGSGHGAADGRGARVPVTCDRLHQLVAPGDPVLADDGTLRFTVVRVEGADVVCRAETAGTLRSAKGINLPRADLSGDGLTDRDAAMQRAGMFDQEPPSFERILARLGALETQTNSGKR